MAGSMLEIRAWGVQSYEIAWPIEPRKGYWNFLAVAWDSCGLKSHGINMECRFYSWQQAMAEFMTEFLCPPWNSYVEIITPNMMALGSGAWGAKLGREGWGFMIGMSLLIRRLRRDLPCFFTIPVSLSVSTLILNFPVSRTLRNKCFLFKLPSWWCFYHGSPN